MKKIIIFIGVVVVLFAALAFTSNITNQKKVEGNPYGKSELDAETIKQLDNPNYQNLILPDQLEETLANEGMLSFTFTVQDVLLVSKRHQ